MQPGRVRKGACLKCGKAEEAPGCSLLVVTEHAEVAKTTLPYARLQQTLRCSANDIPHVHATANHTPTLLVTCKLRMRTCMWRNSLFRTSTLDPVHGCARADLLVLARYLTFLPRLAKVMHRHAVSYIGSSMESDQSPSSWLGRQ
jgi:hypothetical protein